MSSKHQINILPCEFPIILYTKSMKRSLLFVLLVSVLTSLNSCQGKSDSWSRLKSQAQCLWVDFTLSDESPVLAIVGDQKITSKEFADYLATIPPSVRKAYELPTARRQLLDTMISQKVLVKAARDNHFEADPEFRRSLEEEEDQWLAQAYENRLSSSIQISASEARQYYQENLNLFRPKFVNVSYMSFSTLQAAKKAQSLLRAGVSFEKVARRMSIDRASAKMNGHLAPTSLDQFDPQVQKVLSSLTANKLSNIFKSSSGYAIYRLDGIDETPMPFEAVRDQIVQKIKDKRMDEKTSQLKATVKIDIVEKALADLNIQASDH